VWGLFADQERDHNVIRAKSSGLSLEDHTSHVIAAASTLVERCGTAALSAFGLPVSMLPRLRETTLRAARVHDWGKATSSYQGFLEDGSEQILRHEILSGILARGAGESPEVLAVAVGHHRKFNRDFWSPKGIDCRIFSSAIGQGEDYVLDQRELRRELHELLDTLELWAEDLTEGDRRLVALCRLFLIAADGAASARRSGAPAFLGESLAHGLEALDYSRIIEARYPRGFCPRPFQITTSKAGPSVLVVAGCGSGKSAAAYLWAREMGRKRFFFCLPTTGTATEHWMDYAKDFGSLIHSRVEVDYALLGREGAEGVELWSTPLVVCTADTVLGVCSWSKKASYGFPAFLDATFVFDEIHSYDRVLFGRLLAFLRLFPDAPVLLATASLPRARLEALREARPSLEIIEGPRELENLPRYEPPGAGCSGDRVLAVRNTVGRAVEAWKGHGFLCHSRFRYCDRVRIHRHAIDAFKAGACRLTATQVAEMSLDLSADSLDTEEAPIPAMIQRLGRLNRFGEQTGRWSVCPVKEPLPYTMDELEQTRRWLNVLRGYGSRLSQSDLVRAWEESGHADEDCQPLEVMTDPLIVRPEPNREDGTTIPVLLESDVERVPDVWRARRVYLKAHEVPIPFRREVLGWQRVDATPVAPEEAIGYDPVTGAAWHSST
jgi:CRISPR-associated endonuclease/helicase Cas3